MANNTDRLFREGLDQYEVTPQAQSWKEVQSILNKKKKAAWLPISIAAAILLLITAALLVKNYQQGLIMDGPQVADIDYPQPTLDPDRILIPKNGVKVETPADKPITAPSTKQTVLFANNSTKTDKKIEETEPIKMETLELVAIQEVRLQELPQPKFNYGFEVMTVEKPTVKITYIAENDPVQKKNKLNSLITTISKDASPIEILADIRDAKDNIFSRN
ncbi:hypothetical protein [Marinoscillum pacificum]|uniref:hypothetical protein n=1 Tax=Marinoscillum pacificum TaxID=392723 RepID=UPI0021583EA5|nr:hypothetical protein [Marinoscillum pacificum]